MSNAHKIPILKPKLPATSKLVPYLNQIEECRWYTNFGPLTKELERKLACHFGLDEGESILICNGTEAMTLSFLAFQRENARYCVMPSWTFVATPLSAIHAGLTPVFADVNPATWAISPATVDDTLRMLKIKYDDVHSVVPVSPFGAPIDSKSWEEYRSHTGIPILIDAAASFDSVQSATAFRVGELPTMISLHATKVFGVGEGALVLCRDRDFVLRLRKLINFGFWGSRESTVLGKNSKLSEYASAVGLAELDEWPSKRKAWLNCTAHYLEHTKLLASADIRFLPGFGNGWGSSYCNLLMHNINDRLKIEKAMSEIGVETRSWWGRGVHAQEVFSKFPCGPMTATTAIAERTVGVPFYTDLTAQEIDCIAKTAVKALKG